jgi:hypothetical protein
VTGHKTSTERKILKNYLKNGKSLLYNIYNRPAMTNSGKDKDDESPL